jgi:hypothetical protein
MTSLSESLARIREGTRTVPLEKATLAAQVAIQALGIDPKRAGAATREPDAVLARYVIAGVLYRFCRVSYAQLGRKLRCGKATAQARIAAFERLKERDTVLKAAKVALGKLPQ